MVKRIENIYGGNYKMLEMNNSPQHLAEAIVGGVSILVGHSVSRHRTSAGSGRSGQNVEGARQVLHRQTRLGAIEGGAGLGSRGSAFKTVDLNL